MDEHNSYSATKPLRAKKANFVSRALFCWALPLLWRGYRKDLSTADLTEVFDEHLSQNLGDRLEKEWAGEVKFSKESGRAVSFFRCLRSTFGQEFYIWGAVLFVDECFLRIAQPVLLNFLIRCFEEQSPIDKHYGYLYGGLLIAVTFLRSIFMHGYFHNISLLGMKIRIACSSLIYRKLIKMNRTSLSDTSTGQLTNILSNDIFRFEEAIICLHYMWTTPIQAVTCFVLLYKIMGVSSIAGAVLIVLYLPFQIILGNVFSRYREKTAVRTDRRVQLMSEIIHSMKAIKMYAWERLFTKLIEQARSREMNIIKKTAVFKSINQAAYYYFPKLILFLSISWFTYTGRYLTAEILFSAAGLYNIFRLSFGYFFPLSFSSLGEMRVSASRIQNFLVLPECDWSDKMVVDALGEDGPLITVSKLRGTWGDGNDKPVINDITFSVRGGELLCIVGKTGSGKSSVLQALVRDLRLAGGSVHAQGSIAYVSQEPWIFNASVRQNVTFGSLFDEAKYQKALECSALERDLEAWPNGDRTVVGDRGMALSGGQKARVSLARALYRDADIYLFDDPLSAVDVQVGQHIFNSCIRGQQGNQAVVLVTHQLQYLPSTDKIIVMQEGVVKGCGSYEELLAQNYDFSAYHDEDDPSGTNTDLIDHEEELNQSTGNAPGPRQALTNDSKKFDFDPDGNDPALLHKGSVSAKVYWSYLTAGTGCCGFIQILLSNLIAEGSLDIFDLLLTHWTAHTKILDEVLSLVHLTPLAALLVLMVIIVVTSLGRTIVLFQVCLKSSKYLHNKMFERIIKAPLTFFSSNPIGIVLNRFSKDLGYMDDNLPLVLSDVLEIFINTVGSLTLVVLTNRSLLYPTLIFFVVVMLLRNFYISSARALKRIEANCRSPVFGYLSATLEGLTDIRTFSQTEKCREEFDNHQNMYTSGSYLFAVASRWQAIVNDNIMTLYMALVIFTFLEIPTEAAGSKIGLAMSTLITMSNAVQWLVHQSSELENQMTSCERVLEYSKLASEAPWDTPHDLLLEKSWPKEGRIVYTDVSLKYSSDNLALSGLTFTLNPKEKIGIVGRTGAGKSSLIVTLFRLTEPEGEIEIDGEDISRLGLHVLRNKISIIPQEPVLFPGSLRNNLDPYNEYNDETLWKVLEEVELKEEISKLEAGLEHTVHSLGGNFSIGQRQLICLARAILKKNKILIMDEATANVDKKTDEAIQLIIRKKFEDCTILTVAHRINTIIDADRVMVMDGGRLVEFDDPYHLLNRPGSKFSETVNETGPASQGLREACKKAHENRTKKND